MGMLDVFDASTASGSVIELVEFGKDLALNGVVLDDRLDDQLTIGQIGKAGGKAQLVQCRGALALGDLADAHAALQRLGDARLARSGQRLGGLVDDDVDAGPGGHLGDAGAHLSRADHAYSFDWIAHFITPFVLLACGADLRQQQAPPNMAGGA